MRIFRCLLTAWFALACGFRAVASPARLQPAQQRLVGYCVSLYHHNEEDLGRYAGAARAFFSRMPRHALREQLGACQAVLPPRTLDSFAVAYTLAYFGVDVHGNVDRMRLGAERVAENVWPAMEEIYVRHPDDYVLSRILWNKSDGAGAESLQWVYSDLFLRKPVAVLRVSRYPRDLVYLFDGFGERDVNWKSVYRSLLKLTRNRDPRVARAARYGVWQCLIRRKQMSEKQWSQGWPQSP